MNIAVDKSTGNAEPLLICLSDWAVETALVISHIGHEVNKIECSDWCISKKSDWLFLYPC